MIFFGRRRRYYGGFFSLASLIELFFANLGRIFIFLISILISGYFLIFYEFGGDFFFDHNILNKPFYVFKYIWQYVKILFKFRKHLEIGAYIKFFFFLLLPYIIYKLLYNLFQFILFFLHKKTQKRMPVFSAFLLRFIKKTEAEKIEKEARKKEMMKQNGFFSNLFKKENKQPQMNNKFHQEEEKKENINLRK